MNNLKQDNGVILFVLKLWVGLYQLGRLRHVLLKVATDAHGMCHQ